MSIFTDLDISNDTFFNSSSLFLPENEFEWIKETFDILILFCYDDKTEFIMCPKGEAKKSFTHKVEAFNLKTFSGLPSILTKDNNIRYSNLRSYKTISDMTKLTEGLHRKYTFYQGDTDQVLFFKCSKTICDNEKEFYDSNIETLNIFF
ncbi:hypothetical protein [Carp edema virus]|nr:hypothetical protein [Carp edema virus]